MKIQSLGTEYNLLGELKIRKKTSEVRAGEKGLGKSLKGTTPVSCSRRNWVERNAKQATKSALCLPCLPTLKSRPDLDYLW